MQDRRDREKEGLIIKRMQKIRDAGNEGFRKGIIYGKVGFRKGGMNMRKNTGLEG